jgi:hypothetical protein
MVVLIDRVLYVVDGCLLNPTVNRYMNFSCDKSVINAKITQSVGGSFFPVIWFYNVLKCVHVTVLMENVSF